MRITLVLLLLSAILLILTLVSGGSALFATPLVWLVVLGFPVFVIEALLTLLGAAVFFTGTGR